MTECVVKAVEAIQAEPVTAERVLLRLAAGARLDQLADIRAVHRELAALRDEVERLDKRAAWEGLHRQGCVCVYCAELYPLSGGGR